MMPTEVLAKVVEHNLGFSIYLHYDIYVNDFLIDSGIQRLGKPFVLNESP